MTISAHLVDADHRFVDVRPVSQLQMRLLHAIVEEEYWERQPGRRFEQTMTTGRFEDGKLYLLPSNGDADGFMDILDELRIPFAAYPSQVRFGSREHFKEIAPYRLGKCKE